MSDRALGGDDRAVSEVLGAVLVFGLVLALIVLLQTAAIPQANEETEFKHNERVRGDLAQLAEANARVAGTGSSASVDVKTGLQYPTRVVFLNPPAVAGDLRTRTMGDVEISNVEATDGETDDYIDGSLGTFATNSINYSVDYNEYGGAPETVYEGGVLYNSYDDGLTVADEGNVVSGNRITLLLVDGDLSASRSGTQSVGVEPLSAPAQTVSVTGQGGNNIEITVPTNLDAETWREDILSEERQVNGGNIVDIRNDGSDAIIIELDGSKTYKLRMAKLGVGTGTTEPDEHYVTLVEGDGVSVPEDGQQKLTLQVRDEFNNPVNDATVNFSVESPNATIETENKGPASDLDDVSTDENGMVTVTLAADSSIDPSPQDIDVRASMTGDPSSGDYDATTKENATFEVRLVNTTAVKTGASPLLNPPQGIVLDGAIKTSTPCAGTPPSNCEVDVVFNNTASNEQEIEQMRYVFFSGDSQGRAPATGSGTIEIVAPPSASLTTLERGGDFKSIGTTVSANGQVTFKMQFFDENGDPIEITEGQFFVVSMVVDGQRETYFVAPAD